MIKQRKGGNMTTKTHLNGVDLNQLMDTIDAIKKDPSLAHFQFRSKTEWINGGHSRTTIQNFHGAGQEDRSRQEPFVVEGDEPPVLLGNNAGPNAVESVLHALASCLAVGVAYNAAAKGIDIMSLDFELEGDLDLHAFLGLSEDRRPGYKNITVNYRIESDASRKEIEELCAYVQKTSPVLDIIRNAVPVTINLKN
jgi:uncharacterized OsmC-like protein